MDKDKMVIRCLNCGVKNRIPSQRLQDRPTCGSCHAPLDEMIIRCLQCGTKNRMPENRLHDRPLCGKCGAALVMMSEQGRPVDVTDASFSREVLSAGGSVVVDCWAPWCAPCRTLQPILEELAAKYAGGVKIAKLNVDENPLTAMQYKISSIPTMIFFKDGQVVDRLTGALPKGDIEKHLLAAMQTN